MAKIRQANMFVDFIFIFNDMKETTDSNDLNGFFSHWLFSINNWKKKHCCCFYAVFSCFVNVHIETVLWTVQLGYIHIFMLWMVRRDNETSISVT